MHESGGNCAKYLKRGWNRKEERVNKNFKKGGQAGSMGRCLKKRCLEPPYKKCSEKFLLIKIEKQVVLSTGVREKNTLQFLVNKANTLNVSFVHSTWAGILLPFF